MEETFKAWVADRINNKPFEGTYDQTKKTPLGRRGNETFIKGSTGVAQIDVSHEGDGFGAIMTARITIPVNSHYARKHFIGIGSEHPKDEKWDTTYVCKVTYIQSWTSRRFTDIGYAEHSTAADHDAVIWSHDQLMEDVINKLTVG